MIFDRDEAIATLFHAFYPKLVRTGYGLAGDWAVAEELAQESRPGRDFVGKQLAGGRRGL